MRGNGLTHRERGSAMVFAIVGTVIAGLLTFGAVIMATQSAQRGKDVRTRVSNAAVVDAAVTRVIYGYRNDLGSVVDHFVLDEEDLRKTIAGDSAATVVPAPTRYARLGGVWAHVPQAGGGTKLQPEPRAQLPSVAVSEPIMHDAAACTAAGIPASACTEHMRGQWQVYRIELPDITGSHPPNVVVYVRSWLASAADPNVVGTPSYARVELRPGRFADYQLVSDSRIVFGGGARIDGPVHSNGLASPDPTVDEDEIELHTGVQCTDAATLTVGRGTIGTPDGSPVPAQCNGIGETGQVISFLRAIDSMDDIAAIAASGMLSTVRSYTTAPGLGGENAFKEPYHHAYQVVFSPDGTSLQVFHQNGALRDVMPLGRVNALLFDDDVRVRGEVGPDRRITIAARRSGVSTASIFVDGDITKGDANSTAIGLLAQGDVVTWMSGFGDTTSCPVDRMEAAVVAANGGLTIPTRYATSEAQKNVPTCPSIALKGSIAGHRAPTMRWVWPDVASAGFETRHYTWDRALSRNPPPYFPLTGIWQPFSVVDSNIDCLFDADLQTDPECR